MTWPAWVDEIAVTALAAPVSKTGVHEQSLSVHSAVAATAATIIDSAPGPSPTSMEPPLLRL
jgi:hypothetical protein